MQARSNEVNIEQQIDLENQIDDLEEENKYLLEEYNRLRVQLNTAANTILPLHSNHYNYFNGSKIHSQSYAMRGDSTGYVSNGRSMSRERSIIEEAKMLRQHETRLEARMKILENHNRLLDAQLKQLRQLLNSVCCLPGLLLRRQYDFY